MKPTLEIVKALTAARNLIATSDLAKNNHATNNYGAPVYIQSPDAQRFCIAGAIARVEGADVDKTGYLIVNKKVPALQYMVSVLGGTHLDAIDIAKFNDAPGRTKEDVVTFFDIIIAKAKADLKA
jgi:hypothetical protein